MRLPTFSVARVLVGAMVLGLVLAACGGSSDGTEDAGDPGTDILDDALGRSDDDDDDEAAGDAEVDDDDFDPLATGFDGLATLIIQGTTYEFLAPNCIPAVPDEPFAFTVFGVSGEGTVNGEDFWAKVIRLDQDLDGDGEPEELYTFEIEVGAEDLRQAPPGSPSLVLQFTADEDPEAADQIVYEEGRLGGRGEIFDRNGVLAPENDGIPFTFVATCVPS